MAKKTVRYTLTLPENLYTLIDDRSDLNGRSINKEIIFLIEGALAAEIDGNLQILRMLMLAQGGPQPAQTATA